MGYLSGSNYVMSTKAWCKCWNVFVEERSVKEKFYNSKPLKASTSFLLQWNQT